MIKILNYEISKSGKQENLSNDQILKKVFLNQPINVFDIGANIGQSIERFKKIFSTESKIYSFEPLKKCFELLNKKYGNIENVFLYDYLLSGSSKKKKINIASNDKLSSIFSFNKNNKYVKHNNFEMIDEQIIEADKVFTLDNFCSANNINNIDFLKIDTQGSEEEVLKGAKKLFDEKKIKILEIEINFSDEYQNLEKSFYTIEKYIHENYQLLAIPDRGNILTNILYSLNVLYVEKNFLQKIKTKFV